MGTNRTKILVFSLTYFPFIGGAEVALKEITKRISNVEFDLITAKLKPDLPRREKQASLNIYRLGRGSIVDKYLFPIRAFLFSRQLHKKNNYSLIWSMMAAWAAIPALLFKLTHKKVKYLLTLQSGDSDLFINLRTWFWYPIYKMIYSKADHIQAISKWLEKRARKYGYQGDISVIPNGVSQIEKINEKEIKEKLGIKENSKVIFTISRLVKKNGLKYLIQSMKDLPANLVIIGSGELEQKLKSLAKKLNIENKVIFLGRIDNEIAITYYSIADIFCRPSLSEGQGISFIEAMSAEVPVIATPVGGIPDFLIDGQTGWFCRPKDPRSIAEKIEYILNPSNKEKVGQVVANGKALVDEKYNWDPIAIKMEKILCQ